MEGRSYIGVQNVQKILFGPDQGRSHKTSRSHSRGSFVSGRRVWSVFVYLLKEHVFITGFYCNFHVVFFLSIHFFC